MRTSDTPRPGISLTTICLTSLLTGTLDAAAALVHYYAVGGRHPARIWEFIASAVFGARALYAPSFAVWGILFHYLIAYSFTATFLLVYPRVRFLRFNWVLSGIGYGALVWAIMNVLVVPHTNVAAWSFTLGQALVAGAILIVCIGLPTAFIARKSYAAPAPG